MDNTRVLNTTHEVIIKEPESSAEAELFGIKQKIYPYKIKGALHQEAAEISAHAFHNKLKRDGKL